LGRVLLILRRPRLRIRLLLTVWLLPWLSWLPGVLLADWPLLLGSCARLVRERVVLVQVPRLVLPRMLAIALLRVFGLSWLAEILRVRQFVFPPSIGKAPIASVWLTCCARWRCTGVMRLMPG
jgi:hypothetical protein